jgi:hypothetical protein
MDTASQPQLIGFLQNELGVSNAEIELGLRHIEQSSDLPLILWQYGVLSLAQLDCLFDWMDQNCW